MSSETTTIGNYRLGLLLVNARERVDAQQANEPLPDASWVWVVRELGRSWDGKRMLMVPHDMKPTDPEVRAQAFRMLQAAATA